jgi:RNA polymerase sigma-70 factor, ECF subfamily
MNSNSINIPVQDIVRELKAGNQILFEQVFNEYYKLLYYEAKGYFRSEPLVEEIVCDVFTRIWINREKLNITSSLRDYLIRSVHNNCIDYYRMQKKQERINLDLHDVREDYFSLTDIGENPLDYILTKELEDCITDAINRLPEQYRKTFLMSRVNELTYEEIAIKMGISVNSVKTNIKNALSKLREELKAFLSLLLIWFLMTLS